jgi:hypothetical protein
MFTSDFPVLRKDILRSKPLVGKHLVGFFSTLMFRVLAQIYARGFSLAREKVAAAGEAYVISSALWPMSVR